MTCQTIRTKYSGETLIYYADLLKTLAYNATVSTFVSATSPDAALVISNPSVLGVNTTVLDDRGAAYVIPANKGVMFSVAGGTPGDGTQEFTTVVVVRVTTSTGETVEEPFRLRVLKASGTQGDTLTLTQGDTYDGIANPLMRWAVATDYTDAWAVTLTIRDEDDAIVYTTSGVVASATLITVNITTPTGLTMTGCPGQWQGKFDVQVSKAGSVATIAAGKCYINEDQTR